MKFDSTSRHPNDGRAFSVAQETNNELILLRRDAPLSISSSSVSYIAPGKTICGTDASTNIPFEVVTDHILPFVPDRRTWNAVALTCRDVFHRITAHHDRVEIAHLSCDDGAFATCLPVAEDSMALPPSLLCWPWPERVQLPTSNDFGLVSCVAFSSPESEMAMAAPSRSNSLSLMACGSIFRIDVFESRRGHVLTFENLQGTIKSMAFSSLMRTSSNDDNDDISAQGFGSTSRYLVACSSGSNPRLWRISDEDCVLVTKVKRSEDYGRELRLAGAGGGQPNEITFSSDDKFVLCISQDHALWRCDVETGQCLQVASLSMSRWRVKMLGVSPLFEFAALYSAETSGTVQLTKLHRQGQAAGWLNDREIPILLLRHNADVVSDFTFSPCGRHAAMGGDHGIVQLWLNLAVDREIVDNDHRQSGAPHSRDNHKVYRLRGLTSHVTSVTFSPNGRWIAASDWSGLIQVWNMEDIVAGKEGSTARRELNKVDEDSIRTAVPISSLAFTPSSNMLVGTGSYGFVRFWNRTDFS